MKQVNRNKVVPILFNTWSIERILNGTKIQTRRFEADTLHSKSIIADGKHLPGDYYWQKPQHSNRYCQR